MGWAHIGQDMLKTNTCIGDVAFCVIQKPEPHQRIEVGQAAEVTLRSTWRAATHLANGLVL
eukprot:2159966-Amphidinium_carterae.1